MNNLGRSVQIPGTTLFAETKDRAAYLSHLHVLGVSEEDLCSAADQFGLVRYEFNVLETTGIIETVKRLVGKASAPIFESTDPNSLRNRLNDFNQSNPNGIYHDWFIPNPESIALMQRLRIKKITSEREFSENPPKLETSQDYIDYFESFPPTVQDSLIRNLFALELTAGCKSACNSVCSISPDSKITGHIPFEAVIYFMKKRKESSSTEAISIYWSSDIKYYRDGNKTGVDVIKAFFEIFGFYPYISISIGLDKETVDFVVQLLESNLPLQRISRLGGLSKITFETFLSKISKQISLSNAQRKLLLAAYKMGDKSKMGTGNFYSQGNAAKDLLNEEDIDLSIISSRNGVYLRCGQGFRASVLCPPTLQTPDQQYQYRIVPNSDDDYLIPVFYSVDDGCEVIPVIMKPLFETISHNGDISTYLYTKSEFRFMEIKWTAVDFLNKLLDLSQSYFFSNIANFVKTFFIDILTLNPDDAAIPGFYIHLKKEVYNLISILHRTPRWSEINPEDVMEELDDYICRQIFKGKE